MHVISNICENYKNMKRKERLKSMLFSSGDWEWKGDGWSDLKIIWIICIILCFGILFFSLIKAWKHFKFANFIPIQAKSTISRNSLRFGEKMMIPYRLMCIWYKELNGGRTCGSCWQQWSNSAWARPLGPGSGRAQVRNVVHLDRAHS